MLQITQPPNLVINLFAINNFTTIILNLEINIYYTPHGRFFLINLFFLGESLKGKFLIY